MNAPIAVFFDTSVLIAASDAADPRHARSLALLAAATPATAACGAHTLAEVYAVVLSRIPGGKKVRPEHASLLIDQIVAKMTVVPLSAEDYAGTLREAARMGLSGGIVFDALLLACARKVDAGQIYTWNERHFRMVAPDLADRIVTP
jgi:predicted nucleic acid-binding protein